ncbi:hypothetical protein HIM_07690 [Hirsutella minnesotensis 3608]|uniref:Uncharacterized protein n=1 Tax=Hirsutella minnesotensis 3608 TaxID=1043627 RepID=A0A0F7ZYR4_9HYPO|nr:hypothetical protein HIM_07690 [Hirsutella minnesotensis 3608]
MPRAVIRGETESFQFVVGNRPDQLNGHATKRLRSHLSKRGWRRVPPPPRKSSSSTSSSSPPSSKTLAPCSSGEVLKRAVRRKRQGAGTSRRLLGRAAPITSDDSEEIDEARVVPTASSRNRLNALLSLSGPLHMDYQLGGGRVDPFHAHPGPWKPYVPALTDHYIVHMAVDIPELDEPGRAGLLRSRWYPLVLCDPATFAVVLLLSAANYITTIATGCPNSNTTTSSSGSHSSSPPSASSTHDLDGSDPDDSPPAYPGRAHILHLRQAAIGAINAALRDPRRRLSDEVVGAVAKMASFEAMHGDLATYRTHMEGLRMMLRLRGGVDSLGLGGLLRRMIVWIDVNSAFLLGIDRYFPGLTFAGGAAMELVEEPNPARFIAVRRRRRNSSHIQANLI